MLTPLNSNFVSVPNFRTFRSHHTQTMYQGDFLNDPQILEMFETTSWTYPQDITREGIDINAAYSNTAYNWFLPHSEHAPCPKPDFSWSLSSVLSVGLEADVKEEQQHVTTSQLQMARLNGLFVPSNSPGLTHGSIGLDDGSQYFEQQSEPQCLLSQLLRWVQFSHIR